MSKFFAASESSSDDLSSGGEGELAHRGGAAADARDRRPMGLFETVSFSDSEYDGSDDDARSAMSDDEDEDLGGDATLEGGAQGGAPARKSRFLFDSDSESEDDDVKRLVKSQKEKARDEMRAVAAAIEDAIAAGREEVDEEGEGEGSRQVDWVSVQGDIERLLKAMTKYEAFGVPRAAYMAIAAVEDAVTVCGQDAAQIRALNAIVAKAYNALRQRIRKVATTYSDAIQHAQENESDGDDASSDEEGGAAAQGGAAAVEAYELTPMTVLRKLHELIAMRGRKNVDKQENIATLRTMVKLAPNARQAMHVLVALVSASFEASMSHTTGYYSYDVWAAIVGDLSLLVGRMAALAEEEQTATPAATDSDDTAGLPTIESIRGALLSYLNRIDDEFVRALQNVEAHTQEYADFVLDEPRLLLLLERGRRLLRGAHIPASTRSLLARQIEHLYYKTEGAIEASFGGSSEYGRLFGGAAAAADDDASLPLVTLLCRTLYQEAAAAAAEGGEGRAADERLCIRALLYHIYYLAAHDKYERAYDLFAVSKVQERLASLDVANQILYNRAVVQLGLAAFRGGNFRETYFALQEICSSGRPKELLAQGFAFSKYGQHGADEVSSADRSRILPVHMHLNIEVLDCIFLTVSMLYEVPQTIASAHRHFRGDRRLFQSRHLRRIIDAHDRMLFNGGPPESVREQIVAASKALAQGRWRQAQALLDAISLWDGIPSTVPERSTRALLGERLCEAALYIFIYSVGARFTTLSLAYMARECSLDIERVRAICTLLCSEYGLPATIVATVSQGGSGEGPALSENMYLQWDSSSELTPIQEVALQLRDKARHLEERNRETADLCQALKQAYARNVRIQESFKST